MSESLTRPAHAKINLALSVGPPVPPPGPKAGFHPIASWMACIELADELTFTSKGAGPSRYAIEWAHNAPRRSPIDWPLEKDLAVRAHRLMERLAGRELPVDLRLVKRTPVGGGLGGGSSDAACAILALRDLFGLPIPMPALRAGASELGSDVAFFLDDERPARPALVAGFGERIERLGRVPAEVLLVMPPFGCPTGQVYRTYDASPRARREQSVRGLAGDAARTAELPLDGLFNDLEEPACAVEPRLRVLLSALRAGSPLKFLVTGSGSTIVGLGNIDDQRAAAIRALASRAVPGTVVVRTCLA